jgi:hypothetical protein
MKHTTTLCAKVVIAMRNCANWYLGLRGCTGVVSALLLFALAAPATARAADGCVVLLCFAAPSWRAIPQCVGPVRQVLRDLARGKPFPFCRMTSAGNEAQHSWASAPDFCPPQYTRLVELRHGPIQVCNFSGAVSVSVDGTPFARTWWSPSGTTVTEFSPAAKAKLGTWDTRFDDDYAVWLASRSLVDPNH